MKIFKIILFYFAWVFLEISTLYAWWHNGIITHTGNMTMAYVILFLFNLGLFGLLTRRIRNLVVFPNLGDKDYINIYIPSVLFILCSILQFVFLKFPEMTFFGFTFNSSVILFIFIIGAVMDTRPENDVAY